MSPWKRALVSIFILLLMAQLALPCFATNGDTVGTDDSTTEPVTEPLATVACLADLGRLADSLETAEEKRLMLYRFSRHLAKDGMLDAVVLGGDTSDKPMTEEMWRYSMKQISEVLAEASETVLYTVGNTDYIAGESGDYNSGDYYNTVMADRLGTLYYWDFYYETYNGVKFPTAYRYYVGGVYFYFLNTAPSDMAGALHYGNFVYTQRAMSWIEDKMKTDDPNGDATMFLVAHFPPEGDGTRVGALEAAVSERLTQICTEHANLIYLYANTDAAQTDTAETVIPFTNEGLVLTETEEESEGLGLASLWTVVSCGENMVALQNGKNGHYLAIEDGVRLTLSDEPAAWITETVNGRVSFLAADRVNGLRVAKSGTPAFSLGTATPMEVYIRSADEEGTLYTYSADILPGTDCAIVSDAKHVLSVSGQEVVTGEARVIGDELVGTEPKTAVDGTPGFTAVSMGTVDEGGETIQYLTLSVYSDRVELQLNNYHTATEKITPLNAFVRANLPTPERITIPSTKKPATVDPFNMKLYLLVMAGAILVGGGIGTFVTVRSSRHRFFE